MHSSRIPASLPHISFTISFRTAWRLDTVVYLLTLFALAGFSIAVVDGLEGAFTVDLVSEPCYCPSCWSEIGNHTAAQELLGRHRRLDWSLHSEAVGCSLPVGRQMKRGIPVRYCRTERRELCSTAARVNGMGGCLEKGSKCDRLCGCFGGTVPGR